jgi:hypothetical protein
VQSPFVSSPFLVQAMVCRTKQARRINRYFMSSDYRFNDKLK